MVILRPDAAPELLCDLSERIELLRAAGADEVRVVEFTRRVAGWTPQEFVERVLLPLHPSAIVVGENFRFGHKAAGTVDTLRELGAGVFEVKELPLVSDASAYSSSRIRRALDDGDVEAATAILGRPFRYTGIVVMGDQRGRTLGYPTANLTVPETHACPADGVYAGWLTCLDKPGAEPMPAAISVGTNPTFDGGERRVETYVLDRTDLELYGCRIGVDFVTRLRGQVKFSALDDLIVQMDADIVAARQVLSPGTPST
jgi:riboflavin kinase/FMN adenylyltransferase